MKFLCLGYLNMDQFDAAPEGVKAEILAKCYEQCLPFRATGQVVAEESLGHTGLAKTIRSRGGKPFVSDGPFIETKEQLGSFFIVEADSMEDAIEVASLHPAAFFGEEYGFGIEIRPIGS
ncbi:MAG: YciI family protein [Fimbriimonas sp.]